MKPAGVESGHSDRLSRLDFEGIAAAPLRDASALGYSPLAPMKAYSLRDARRLAIGTNDWRQAMWNKWLVGYLTPREDERNPDAEKRVLDDEHRSIDGQNDDQRMDSDSAPSPSSPPRSERRAATTMPPGAGPTHSGPARPGPEHPGPAHVVESDGIGTEVDRMHRIRTTRSRLAHMANRLEALELALDRQQERENLSRVQDRVQKRELADILDRLVEAQDRQTQGIISCTRALERLERRLIAQDRRRALSSLRFDAVGLDGADSGPDSSEQGPLPSNPAPRVRASGISPAPVEVPAPLSGKLSEISLPTLLSMAELERWTGRLTLEAHARTVQIDLEAGLLVGVFDDDSPSDAVETLYDLIEVRDGKFSFTPARQVAKTELAPMTVGTLLLRASHRRDELGRLDAQMGS